MSESKWKELCHAIMHETDPAALVGLVDELNRALEQRGAVLRHSRRGESSRTD